MTIEHISDRFSSVGRQEFRRFFQPSRIVLGIFHSVPDQINLITLCFDMYCSYKPPMMAFAIQRGAYSYKLLQEADQCVLAVPGERLAEETLLCGVTSGLDINKVQECQFKLVESKNVSVPGIEAAIANIEVRIVRKVPTGDHLTAICEVVRFAVNKENHERCLLSIGPLTEGFRVLARQGIHRIGIVESHHGHGGGS